MDSSTICYCGHQGEEVPVNAAKGSLPNEESPSPSPSTSIDAHQQHAQSTTQQKVVVVVCQPCATRILSSQIARYHDTVKKHAQKKSECRQRILETRLACSTDGDSTNNEEALAAQTRRHLPDPNQINAQLTYLKKKFEFLQNQTSALALKVTAKTMENEEREEQLGMQASRVAIGRDRLERMRQCMLLSSSTLTHSNNIASSEEEKKATEGTLIQEEEHEIEGQGGGLRDALISGTREIQSLRFQYALKVFDMHRIDVGEPYNSNSTGNNNNNSKSNNESKPTATGVGGKISNLPLPHAGPALYGVLPPMVLASSLRLVASLTNLVARCLGVILPHPILVCEREENWCREKCCGRCGKVGVYALGGSLGGDVIKLADNGDDGENDWNLCTTCTEEGGFEQRSKEDGISPLRSHMQKHSIPAGQQSAKQRQQPSRTSNSKSFLSSLVGSSARKAMALASWSTTPLSGTSQNNLQQKAASSSYSTSQSGRAASSHQPNSIRPITNSISTSPASISKRINNASFAVLLENHESDATEYILNPPRWKEDGNNKDGISNQQPSTSSHPSHRSTLSNNRSQNIETNNGIYPNQAFSTRDEFHEAEERFATGLQLLQNDVMALCFRAGVDISTLWPAESVLLNLHALWCHCQKMVDAT